MKPTSFAALALVTVLALMAAIATYTAQNRWAQAKVSGASLFPSLAAQADRITKIELSQGGKAVTLARDNERWLLADRGGYPAKPDAVRALLVKVAQAELVEGKTRNKDRYGVLELEDPGKDAKSRLLRLIDDKGGVIAETIIGKRRYDAFGSSKSGTYVRKPGDIQTWLSNADLDVSVAVRDWVKPGLLDLSSNKIAKLTVEIPGEEPLVVTRDAADANKHALTGIPEGKKLKEGAGIDSIVRAAGTIDLEDVRKPVAADAAGTEAGLAKIEGDGGLNVTLRLRKEGEDYWLSIEAAGGEGDAKKTADDITARTQGWEFKISSGKAQSLLKRRADLFEAS
jgi:hypothetical protein